MNTKQFMEAYKLFKEKCGAPITYTEFIDLEDNRAVVQSYVFKSPAASREKKIAILQSTIGILFDSGWHKPYHSLDLIEVPQTFLKSIMSH